MVNMMLGKSYKKLLSWACACAALGWGTCNGGLSSSMGVAAAGLLPVQQQQGGEGGRQKEQVNSAAWDRKLEISQNEVEVDMASKMPLSESSIEAMRRINALGLEPMRARPPSSSRAGSIQQTTADGVNSLTTGSEVGDETMNDPENPGEKKEIVAMNVTGEGGVDCTPKQNGTCNGGLSSVIVLDVDNVLADGTERISGTRSRPEDGDEDGTGMSRGYDRFNPAEFFRDPPVVWAKDALQELASLGRAGGAGARATAGGHDWDVDDQEDENSKNYRLHILTARQQLDDKYSCSVELLPRREDDPLRSIHYDGDESFRYVEELFAGLATRVYELEKADLVWIQYQRCGPHLDVWNTAEFWSKVKKTALISTIPGSCDDHYSKDRFCESGRELGKTLLGRRRRGTGGTNPSKTAGTTSTSSEKKGSTAWYFDRETMTEPVLVRWVTETEYELVLDTGIEGGPTPGAADETAALPSPAGDVWEDFAGEHGSREGVGLVSSTPVPFNLNTGDRNSYGGLIPCWVLDKRENWEGLQRFARRSTLALAADGSRSSTSKYFILKEPRSAGASGTVIVPGSSLLSDEWRAKMEHWFSGTREDRLSGSTTTKIADSDVITVQQYFTDPLLVEDPGNNLRILEKDRRLMDALAHVGGKKGSGAEVKIKMHKADLRLYVILRTDPLRIYIHRDGWLWVAQKEWLFPADEIENSTDGLGPTTSEKNLHRTSKTSTTTFDAFMHTTNRGGLSPQPDGVLGEAFGASVNSTKALFQRRLFKWRRGRRSSIRDFVERHYADGGLILGDEELHADAPDAAGGADPNQEEVKGGGKPKAKQKPQHQKPRSNNKRKRRRLRDEWPRVWTMIKENTARSILSYARRQECIGGSHVDQELVAEHLLPLAEHEHLLATGSRAGVKISPQEPPPCGRFFSFYAVDVFLSRDLKSAHVMEINNDPSLLAFGELKVRKGEYLEDEDDENTRRDAAKHKMYKAVYRDALRLLGFSGGVGAPPLFDPEKTLSAEYERRGDYDLAFPPTDADFQKSGFGWYFDKSKDPEKATSPEWSDLFRQTHILIFGQSGERKDTHAVKFVETSTKGDGIYVDRWTVGTTTQRVHKRLGTFENAAKERLPYQISMLNLFYAGEKL
eukprot:g11919.t1